MPTFGPGNATCEVLVFRDGLLSAVAHDLLLHATEFSITVADDRASVLAEIHAASLRVVTALRDGRELPGALRAGDVRKIEATIVDEVLHARRFPTIRFASTAVTPRGDGYDVSGQLTLGSTTRAVVLPVVRGADRLSTEARIHQPAFGIRPYTAMLGALRVKPDVLVRASVRVPR